MIGDKERSAEILLVEDNDGDIFLTRKAFQKARISNRIYVAKDGEIAMDMLQNKGEHKDMPQPDIVLLDINLPKKDGKQVLAEMKEDEDLRRIPVVILTSSHAEKDVLKSYDLHASSYIIKPIDLMQFYDTVTAIENFWFKLVVFPNNIKEETNEE